MHNVNSDTDCHSSLLHLLRHHDFMNIIFSRKEFMECVISCCKTLTHCVRVYSSTILGVACLTILISQFVLTHMTGQGLLSSHHSI